MTQYYFRFVTARGLEYRKVYSSIWKQVTPNFLHSLTADELRACAEAMDEYNSRKEPNQ